MGWQSAFTGGWDAKVIDHMRQYIRPHTTVLDVGAAIGLWTIPLGEAARQAGATVVAVEPLPGNARWLEHNIALNGLEAFVTVHHLAVGSETGLVRLDSDEQAGGSAAVSTDGRGVTVQMSPLDDLELLWPVSFIKMDVEGFELEVLRGASRILEQDRPVIFGEFSREWLAIRHDDPDPLLRSLGDAGYSISAVVMRRSRPWMAADRLVLRDVEPPFTNLTADLLLKPL
jgi:FkbM family methyltransferase